MQCVDHMLIHWRANNDPYLSIIHHQRGKYYCVVNDEFLDLNEPEPEPEGTRLVLRITLKELKSLCTYHANTQIEMII